MTGLEAREQELLQQLSNYHNQKDLYRYLVGLAQKAPRFGADEKAAANLVPGCVSRIWLRVECRDGRVYFAGDGDSQIVKGILCLVLGLVNGQTANEVSAHECRLFTAPPLLGVLPVSKRNGLTALLGFIRELAAKAAGTAGG